MMSQRVETMLENASISYDTVKYNLSRIQICWRHAVPCKEELCGNYIWTPSYIRLSVTHCCAHLTTPPWLKMIRARFIKPSQPFNIVSHLYGHRLTSSLMKLKMSNERLVRSYWSSPWRSSRGPRPRRWGWGAGSTAAPHPTPPAPSGPFPWGASSATDSTARPAHSPPGAGNTKHISRSLCGISSHSCWVFQAHTFLVCCLFHVIISSWTYVCLLLLID